MIPSISFADHTLQQRGINQQGSLRISIWLWRKGTWQQYLGLVSLLGRVSCLGISFRLGISNIGTAKVSTSIFYNNKPSSPYLGWGCLGCVCCHSLGRVDIASGVVWRNGYNSYPYLLIAQLMHWQQANWYISLSRPQEALSNQQNPHISPLCHWAHFPKRSFCFALPTGITT